MKLPTEHVLPNGLRVVLVPCEAESVAFGLFVRSGSRHESAKTAGISHFIEHMLFKGTAKRSALDITLAIEGRGGNFNACTDEETTCYYAHVPDNHLDEAIDILSDMYLNAAIPDDEFAREKRVVIEELKMYHDEPDSVALENMQMSLFSRDQFGKPVGGTPESLAPMKPADLRRYMRSHYLPSNTVAVVAGAFDELEALKMVTKAFSKVRRGNPFPVTPVDLKTPPIAKHIETRKEISQAQLALGYRSYSVVDRRKYAGTVMDAILGRGMSSRLFQEVREKRGLSYDISSRIQFFSDTGMFVIAAGVDPDQKDELISVIDGEIKRIREQPVDDAELSRVKEFMIGNFRLSYEKLVTKMFFYGQLLLIFDRLVLPTEQIDAVNRVTPAMVQAAAKTILRPRNRCVSWVIPEKA